MVTRTPKETQAALGKAARLSGLSRNVIAAQERNMKTFLNEADGKEKAAVTREDMTKVGLNPKLTDDLTKYLNMKNRKGRKPIEGDFKTTIKTEDKKDESKTKTRASKVIYRGGRPGGRDDSKKVVKRKTPQFTEAVKKSQDKAKKSTSILSKIKDRVTQDNDAKPLRDPKELLALVGGATALTRAAPSVLRALLRSKGGQKVSNKVINYVRKLKDKRKDTNIRTQSGSGKTIQLGGAVKRPVQGPTTPKKITGAATRKITRIKKKETKPDTTNKKTFERMKEIERERATPEYKAKIARIKKEDKERFARNEKRRRDKITAKRNQTIKNKKEDEAKKLAKKQTGSKLNQVQKLYKQFKNNPKGINNAIDKLDMSPAAKSKLRQEVQSYKPSLKEKSELGLKKGGLIKRNMGGNLKQPPAGNKGLRKLPTPVRNKMGFAKRGGVVKKNTGGFLGAGKALRGQGAVMRKKGGKIGY
jgi:hypothetical protein